MINRLQFQAARDALEGVLREGFPNAVVQDFGGDTLNPGVKVDVSTAKGMANIRLWQNLSFDVEAIENTSGRLLLHKSSENVTPSEVTAAIGELMSALR